MPPCDFVVWCPSEGAETTLGAADYSYEFVLRQFLPVLQQLGRVERVSDPAQLGDMGAGSDRPLFLSFAPPHRTPRPVGLRTIPVFAWEFDRLPDESFGGNPDNDWRLPLAQCGSAITHSQFAVDVTRRSLGAEFAVVSLPAPVWDSYTAPARTRPPLAGALEIDGVVIDTRSPRTLAADLRSARNQIEWNGPLFTAVFNPEDGRKNWRDLLRGFVFALRDEPDATLLIKVVHSDPDRGVAPIVADLRRLGDFACRVVVVQSFLPHDDYRALIAGTTFAVNASRGEGQCLPLMEFMSGGVPAVAPDHTAMADYVSVENAFVVASGCEPSSWPQDPRLIFTCNRRAVEWESLVAAFRRAFDCATSEPRTYAAMSAAAVASTQQYCSSATVIQGLREFLALVPAVSP